LREEVGDLSCKDQQFVRALEVLGVERHIPRRGWLGRRPKDRKALARAFVAKAFYNIATTGALLERLRVDKVVRRICGWERKNQVPSESTFSRAFEEFARSGLADRVHEWCVKEYVGDDVVWHVSRDSTAIEARERPVAKRSKAAVAKPKRKRGRPRKGEVRPAPEKSRLEKQRDWSLAECLADLPRACDIGTKRNSKGHTVSWVGLNFHVDVSDGGIPLSGITNSASVHDSQVAIPLMKMTSDRVDSFYDLMDPAYDAELVRRSSIDMDHVPIIEANRRRGEKAEMEPDRARRYKNRTAVERFNSELKDNHGGTTVRVRGHNKVHAHLMFGLLVIFAEAVIGLVT